jgi:ATP synthase protein I
MSQDSVATTSHRTTVTAPRIDRVGSADPRSAAEGRRGESIDPTARKARSAYNALNASSVGLELGLSVAIGLLAGYYLDKYLHTAPWMLLSWMLIGLIAGFRGVFRAIARADRAAAIEDAEAGRG